MCCCCVLHAYLKHCCSFRFSWCVIIYTCCWST